MGYGEQYPVTIEGRLIAVALMLSGIALIGVITATFASWLVERVEQVEEESRAATREDFQVLAAQLAEIRTALAASGHPEVTVAGEGDRGGR